MNFHIRTLDSVEEVQALDGMLGDYIRFVVEDLQRATGVSFDADELLTNTLNSLEKVVPPNGQTFVAEAKDGLRLGMVFLRPSGADAMEIKRLYVPPAGRGKGVGQALLDATIEAARRTGAQALRLDTSVNLTPAIAMYRKSGFVDRAPYHESDHFDDPILGPHLLFMEKPL